MFGGPIVNRLGTKWALVIGAMSFPIRGACCYMLSWAGAHISQGARTTAILPLGPNGYVCSA